jgi:hypothetical protein
MRKLSQLRVCLFGKKVVLSTQIDALTPTTVTEWQMVGIKDNEDNE